MRPDTDKYNTYIAEHPELPEDAAKRCKILQKTGDADLIAYARWHCAQEFAEQKSWKKAFKYFTPILLDFPDWPELHCNLGACYANQKNPSEALTHHSKAIQLLNDDPYIDKSKPGHAALLGQEWLLRGDSHMQLHEFSYAQACLEKGREILQLHPDHAGCRKWLMRSDNLEVNIRARLLIASR